MLDHERLEVYQVARELSREICRVRKTIRRGRPDLVDQLVRATPSIPLNIAEGSGERTPGRRAYFYRIARSSATEVSSALDHIVDMELLKAVEIDTAKQLLVRIVSMLVKLTDTVTRPDSFPPLPKPRQPRKR
ncbi:MAG: four helix bundle protein [Gemmatimonadetes bacterium]|nr:four helix bundle protein [Gemmatimonadota bacterium]